MQTAHFCMEAHGRLTGQLSEIRTVVCVCGKTQWTEKGSVKCCLHGLSKKQTDRQAPFPPLVGETEPALF